MLKDLLACLNHVDLPEENTLCISLSCELSELFCEQFTCSSSNPASSNAPSGLNSFSTKRGLHQNNKDLEEALHYAEQAYEAARELHHEAIPPLLMLCKINYLLGKENEFLRVNGILFSLIKFFHEGKTHPILIKVFELLGDIFQKAGYFPTSLSYFNEAYLLSKLHLGFTHPIGLRILRKISCSRIAVNDY